MVWDETKEQSSSHSLERGPALTGLTSKGLCPGAGQRRARLTNRGCDFTNFTNFRDFAGTRDSFTLFHPQLADKAVSAQRPSAGCVQRRLWTGPISCFLLNTLQPKLTTKMVMLYRGDLCQYLLICFSSLNSPVLNMGP